MAVGRKLNLALGPMEVTNKTTELGIWKCIRI